MIEPTTTLFIPPEMNHLHGEYLFITTAILLKDSYNKDDIARIHAFYQACEQLISKDGMDNTIERRACIGRLHHLLTQINNIQQFPIPSILQISFDAPASPVSLEEVFAKFISELFTAMVLEKDIKLRKKFEFIFIDAQGIKFDDVMRDILSETFFNRFRQKIRWVPLYPKEEGEGWDMRMDGQLIKQEEKSWFRKKFKDRFKIDFEESDRKDHYRLIIKDVNSFMINQTATIKKNTKLSKNKNINSLNEKPIQAKIRKLLGKNFLEKNAEKFKLSPVLINNTWCLKMKEANILAKDCQWFKSKLGEHFEVDFEEDTQKPGRYKLLLNNVQPVVGKLFSTPINLLKPPKFNTGDEKVITDFKKEDEKRISKKLSVTVSHEKEDELPPPSQAEIREKKHPKTSALRTASSLQQFGVFHGNQPDAAPQNNPVSGFTRPDDTEEPENPPIVNPSSLIESEASRDNQCILQ